jgi:uncharacterized protein (TIGR02444 family)
MLLFCAWLGASRKMILGAEQLGSFEDAVRHWHEDVVKPLRHARDAIKATRNIMDEEIGALRQDVLTLELRAERIEQALLYQAAAAGLSGSASHSADAAIRANVHLYLHSKAGAAGRSDPVLPAALIAAAARFALPS